MNGWENHATATCLTGLAASEDKTMDQKNSRSARSSQLPSQHALRVSVQSRGAGSQCTVECATSSLSCMSLRIERQLITASDPLTG